jgi:hypothetical protein
MSFAKCLRVPRPERFAEENFENGEKTPISYPKARWGKFAPPNLRPSQMQQLTPLVAKRVVSALLLARHVNRRCSRARAPFQARHCLFAFPPS